ncbi:hypothetical protein BT69DRAFT_986605 [Atractiella rhizophila]|nr:hypothetical protein BT69DRAFT_986605 [Atractiella rhizophila]
MARDTSQILIGALESRSTASIRHFNRAPRSHSQEPQNIRPSTASGKMSIAGHFVRRSESAISINPVRNSLPFQYYFSCQVIPQVRPSTASGTSAAKFNAFSHAYAPTRSFTSVPTNEVAEDVLVTRPSEPRRNQRSSSFNAFSHAAPKRPPRPERGLSILYSDDQTIIPPTTEQVDLKENSEAPVSNDLPPSSPVEPFNAFAHTSKRRSRPNSAEHNVTVVPPTPGAETNVVEEPEPTAEPIKAPTPPPLRRRLLLLPLPLLRKQSFSRKNPMSLQRQYPFLLQ